MASSTARSAAVSDTTWERIADNLAGRPEAAALRSKRLWRTAFFAALAVAVVAGVLIGLVAADSVVSAFPERRPGWWSLASTLSLVLAVASWVGGWVWLKRHDGFPPGWSNPTRGVPRRERQWIDRATRGDASIPAGRTELVREVAVRRRQQIAGTLAVIPGFLLLWGGNLLGNEWSLLSAIQLAAMLLFLVLLVVQLRFRSRTRAFLRRSASPQH